MVNIFLVILLISGIAQPINQSEKLSSISFTVLHQATWFEQTYERPLINAQVTVVDITHCWQEPACLGITYHLLTDGHGLAYTKIPEGHYITWWADPPRGFVNAQLCQSIGADTGFVPYTSGEMAATVLFQGICDSKGNL